MLTRLRVKNFRCLEEIDVPLGSLSAFVGPNGAGKTTILRAMDLVLGELWPSLRSFRIPQDFNGFDTSKDIEIVVEFNPPYVHQDTHSSKHEVKALRLTCKPYKKSGKWGEVGDLHVDLEPLNEKDEVPNVAIGQPNKGTKTQYGPLRVGTELRDHARILFIDHRRSLAQHLPSIRGSILGRLLQKARKEFKDHGNFQARYQEAMDALRTDSVREIEKTVADTTKLMLGFLGKQTTSSIDIGFGFADPANPFNSLRLEYRESGLTVPGEELGLGVQSAMVVGIFEAFRQLGGDFGTIVIEEPEMYLHPQAQRYFYRLLCEMAEKNQCQFIYSTHSPIFADVNKFETLRLVRKNARNQTQVAYVPIEVQNYLCESREKFKLGGMFDTTRNEVLFSSKALLVEGYGDRIAALMLAEKLGIDLHAEAIAVVDCGGKAGIELVARVCKALKILFSVVHDEDIWPIDRNSDDEKRKKQEEENEVENRKNEGIRNTVGTDGSLHIIKPSLEEVLGISRNASDKPRRIAEALNSIDVNNLPEGLQPLVEAIKKITATEETGERDETRRRTGER